MNNKIPTELSNFRNQIDIIDNQIINLLSQRAAIVTEVGQYKKNHNKSFFIHSNREADMIKKLVESASPLIPKSTIVSIWRKIIASSNALEQEIKIAIYNPNKSAEYFYQVKEYYGDFIFIQNHNNITNIISEIEKGQIHIAIFPIDSNIKDSFSEHWWISLANNNKNLKVFAKIPFIQYDEDDFEEEKNLLAVAIKDPEQSLDDKTLLNIEVNSKISTEEILRIIKKSGLSGKILKSAKIKLISNTIFYLVEIDGFFEASSLEINSLSKDIIKPYVKILGYYPAPIRLDSRLRSLNLKSET